MALINNAPPPLGDPIALQTREGYKPGTDPQAGLCSQAWGDWLGNVVANQEKATGRLFSVTLTQQDASIPATDITDGTISAGRYLLHYFANITGQDIGLGGVLDFTFGWLTDGSAMTAASATLSTDAVGVYVEGTHYLRIDSLSPVTYTAVYVPSGGGARYSFCVDFMEVNA